MDYGVVWLKWKIGQILVGPQYFLPSLAKFFICNLERKHGWQSCSWSSYIFAHFFLMLDNVISLFHFFSLVFVLLCLFFSWYLSSFLFLISLSCVFFLFVVTFFFLVCFFIFLLVQYPSSCYFFLLFY